MPTRNLKPGRRIAGKRTQELLHRASELEEEKARLNAIIHGVGDGLVVADKLGRIILVNKAFEDLLGWKLHEIIGKPMVDVVRSETESGTLFPKRMRALIRVLQTGRKYQSAAVKTHYYIRKDGSRFPTSITVTPITQRGKLIGAVEVFRDVTKEKEVDRVKTEFVSLASHQLRSPLTTTRWYIEELLHEELGKLNVEQKEYLRQALDANSKMIRLVKNLLNISRLEAGRLTIEPRLTDCVKLASRVISDHLSFARARNCAITLRKPTKKIPKITVDPELLTQLISNLISNAVKYSSGRHGKGTITVRLTLKKPNFEISVADQGVGIPKEVQHRVFERFFRASNVGNLDAEGTGLGLYLSKLIIDALGGRIWFTSDVVKGSVFTISLPLKGSKAHRGDKKLA